MPGMKVRHATSLALAEKVGKNTISKTGIAILFIIVISALCVAVYEAWLNTFQAVAVLVVMVMVVVGLVVKGREGD
jgi:hypothetical protein